MTISAMAFALWSMIVYAGMLDGYIAGVERNVLDHELGDIQVFAPGYREDPGLYRSMPSAAAMVSELSSAGYRAAPRLLGTGLAAAGSSSAGVAIRGVDTTRDGDVSRIGEQVAQGQWLRADRPGIVVLGKRLVRALDVDLGDEFVLLSQAADGSTANQLYTVGGILKSVSDEVDQAGVYMTAPAFRDLMAFEEGAHQIIVRRPPTVPLDVAAAAVRSMNPKHAVYTWRELVPSLASMLDLTRGAMTAMSIIVYLATGIVILNAMLMAVFERAREFGVLKALGVGPLAVVRMLVIEGNIQTMVAILVGSALALPTLLFLREHGIDLSALGSGTIAGIAWDPVWRAEVDPDTLIAPIVSMVVIVQLALIYPAVRAALIRPIDAMQQH